MRLTKYIVGLSIAGAAVGSFVIVKDWSGGENFEGDEQLGNKTVIITGATSGIGKATAEHLAKRGGRIILACRDMDKCAGVCQELIKTTKNNNLFCRKLDLSSIESIKTFAQEFNKTEQRLDILINNAGILTKNRTVTRDGFESQMGVNFLGRFLLTNLLLDKMKATDSWGRIVNVVCVGYFSTRIDFLDFNQENTRIDYAAKRSSLANINFSVELAERLQGSNVGVYSANPGVVETDLRREFGSHKSSISGTILKPIWVALFRLPRQGCQTILYCALSSELEGKPQHSGKLFNLMQEQEVDKKKVNDYIRKRLWATAERWTRLKEEAPVTPPSSTTQTVQSLMPGSNTPQSSSAVAVAS